MHEGTSEPVAVPVLAPVETRPAARGRGAWLLGLGIGLGIALGVLLSVGVFVTYTFFTQTIPETTGSVQVFNELNELRQQVNQLNEERKRKEQDQADAMRKALEALAPPDRAPEGGAPPIVVPPAKKQGEAAEPRPMRNPNDPFAELDAEIERLEETQKVLNTILDIFSKSKEKPR